MASDTSLVFNILAKDKASAVFDKMKAGAAVAGLAIGAALAAGAAAGLEKSKTDALLAAQLGASGEFAGQLGRVSGKLYAAGFGETAADASKALRDIFQNGLQGDDMTDSQIQKLAEHGMTVAQIMEEDTARVSAAVSQMIRTGMVGSAQEGFDLLTLGAQRGINKSQDLLDTFNEYGTQFRQLGLDGASAMGLMNQAIRAGARDSDTAADALKEFAIRAIDSSTTSAAGYKALGLDAKKMTKQIAQGGPAAAAGLDTVLDRLRNMKDPVAQNAAAVALFGTKAEDLGKSLYSMDLTGAANSMGELEGATQRASDTIGESAGARLDAFKRKAEMALVDTLAKAVPYIESTFGWLSKNSDWVVPLATGLGILAAAIGVIIISMKIWAAVQTVLNLALWTSPITWIVLGIIALVAVIVLIATKTTWFQDLWNTVWGGIKSAAVAVGNWFSGPFANFFVSAWNKITGGLNAIRDAFKSVINWVIGKWNGLSFKIPAISIPGLGQVWGGLTLSVPKLPMLDVGGNITGTGLAVVHRGEQVIPAARTTPLGAGQGGGGLVLRADGSRASKLLLELLRESLRGQGGLRALDVRTGS